ncbi:Scr1 family TA system antitoxin-like transcriptional regulator [Streptomyces sp. NPDC051322]|uniref:Scr1 family TA system antitoxin-like transcriptional regulator n=1 Tax=Streptomyces sp. NPDC051322 TaxID=3154645 RepID=UPI00344B533B
MPRQRPGRPVQRRHPHVRRTTVPPAQRPHPARPPVRGGGAQGALLAAAKEWRVSHLPAWTEEYAQEEAKALAIHMYQNHVVPGLLQTEAYARAVRETHAGLDGPLILLETEERRQLAYIEGQSGGYFVAQQPDLGDPFGKYGTLRAQALTPEESTELIEQVAREL